jgi:hypothetical protein
MPEMMTSEVMSEMMMLPYGGPIISDARPMYVNIRGSVQTLFVPGWGRPSIDGVQ